MVADRVEYSVYRLVDMSELGCPYGGDLSYTHWAILARENGEHDLTLLALRRGGWYAGDDVVTIHDWYYGYLRGFDVRVHCVSPFIPLWGGW